MLTLKIAKELIERGHEILIVSADPPDVDARHADGPAFAEYEYEGIKIHAVGEALRLKNYTYDHEFYHPEIGEHFDTVLDDFKPDLVHIMHAQNLSAAVIEKAKSKGLKVILSPTDFWFICPIVQLKRTDGTICEGPGENAKHCIGCYTDELLPPEEQFVEAVQNRFPVTKAPFADSLISTILYPPYKAKKRALAEQSIRRRPSALRDFGNSVDAICVPTEIMKQLFIKNGFSKGLIHKVPFGIDVELLEPYQEKKTSDTLRVGFIGTIYEHKGLDILIKAFQKLDPKADAILKIYGNTEQFPEYASEMKELAGQSKEHLSMIQFLGTFPNEKLGPILTEIDVLVVPSRWYENTPLVMQSSLATKTPLIATDLGGMSELVEDGLNGFTFKLNDESDLSKKLRKLIDNPELLTKFRENIDKQRTVPDMVDDLEKLYFQES